MPATMKAKPDWLRASVSGRPIGVDREAKILRGYVVAQAGPFKSEGRGEFDGAALKSIVKLGNNAQGGLKSRFTHPDMSNDGLGKFLGRSKAFFLAKAAKGMEAVRADLHFDPTAFDTPHGDLATYIMDLSESDPEALSSSLVLHADEEFRLNKDGTLAADEDGNDLPPLWRPTKLHASDIVDTGDAVDGLLSAPELAQALSVGLTPELKKVLRWDNVVRLASQMLDGLFVNESREVVEARCQEYLRRYLERRYLGWRFEDEKDEPVATPKMDALRMRLKEMAYLTERMVRV